MASYDSAPPAYPQEANAPLLAQAGAPQAGYAGQPLYPNPNAVQYQQVPSDKQAYAYPNQQAVAYQPTTMVQPGQSLPTGGVVFVTAVPDARLHGIKDLLGLSIFTTICCNLLFGIIAIIFSIRVREAKQDNDYERAQSAYKVMLAMNITGIVLTCMLFVILIIIYATSAMLFAAAFFG